MSFFQKTNPGVDFVLHLFFQHQTRRDVIRNNYRDHSFVLWTHNILLILLIFPTYPSFPFFVLLPVTCRLFSYFLSHSLFVVFFLSVSGSTHKHSPSVCCSLPLSQFTAPLRHLAMPGGIIIQHVHNFIESLSGWSDSCSASETL